VLALSELFVGVWHFGCWKIPVSSDSLSIRTVWQHSIFQSDVGDFDWFNLHLVMSHHPSWCYTRMWDHHPQVN
jgi:hypothetical protein